MLVATGAVTGLLRGFVQEVLTLFAWVISLVAIHYAHSAVTHMLEGFIGNHMGTAGVLAFAILLLVPYAVVRLMANHLGRASRGTSSHFRQKRLPDVVWHETIDIATERRHFANQTRTDKRVPG